MLIGAAVAALGLGLLYLLGVVVLLIHPILHRPQIPSRIRVQTQHLAPQWPRSPGKNGD